MANLDDTDNQTRIGNRIVDPIRPLADAILVIGTGKFFTTGRSRIGGKILNAPDDAEQDLNLGSSGYLSGVNFVIFDPCSPIPAINPFWPNMKA